MKNEIDGDECKCDKSRARYARKRKGYSVGKKRVISYFVLELAVFFAVGVGVDLENFRSVGDIVAAEVIDKEIEHCEDARHKAHVIAREQSHRQREDIESGLAFVDDAFNSENHQREKNHGVEPHQVPVICDEETAE